MKYIVENSPTRMVVKLGGRFTNTATCTFDKTSGIARFERTLFMFPRRPIEVPLGEIAAIDILRQSTQTTPGNVYLTQDTYYPCVHLVSGKTIYLSQASSDEETTQVVAEILKFLGPLAAPAPQAATAKLPLRLRAWLLNGALGIAVVMAVLAVIGYISDLGSLPACDSQKARDTMSDVFQEAKLSLTKYNEIKTVASSKDEVTCQASLAIRGGGTLIADYTFYWEGSKVKVRHNLTRS